MKYRVNSNKPETWQLFHRSSSGWCSGVASEISLTFLVSLLIQLAIQSKSYLPRSCIFSPFYGLEKQSHHRPGCTEGCSQEYLGNLSPRSALIILLFTSMFVRLRLSRFCLFQAENKGFSWKWGPHSINTYKECSGADWVLYKILLEKYMKMIRPLEPSRHVLLMCVLLWVKAGKSKVLVLLKAPSWSKKCDWNLGDTCPVFLPEFGGSYLPRKTLR